jgi:hypothetical protein
MELELHVALFLEKKIDNGIQSFKKNWGKNLDIDNYEIY